MRECLCLIICCASVLASQNFETRIFPSAMCGTDGTAGQLWATRHNDRTVQPKCYAGTASLEFRNGGIAFVDLSQAPANVIGINPALKAVWINERGYLFRGNSANLRISYDRKTASASIQWTGAASVRFLSLMATYQCSGKCRPHSDHKTP